MRPIAAAILTALACSAAAWAGDPAPETICGPVEARAQLGRTIVVEMTVGDAKDRLEKRGEVYLDSEADFRDAKNFAVVVTRAGAASLAARSIASPADHFRGRSSGPAAWSRRSTACRGSRSTPPTRSRS